MSHATQLATDPPRKLDRNHGGYRGETIEVDTVVADLVQKARRHGWDIEPLEVEPGLPLVALHRPARDDAPVRRLYLSSGIHGDEPAGPLALSHLVGEDRWPAAVEIWIAPCLNPTGFRLNRRESARGLDLNRDYRHRETAEVRTHVAWLERLPAFDLAVCLHEDWEAQGFYLYELNPGQIPSPSESVIAAVRQVCPIDHSTEIDGRPAQGGIIRPSLDPASRPQWPEAFYLVQHKTRHSLTLEAPSDFPLPTRVTSLVTAVRVLLEWDGP